MAKRGATWKEVDKWAKKAKRKSSQKQPTLKIGVTRETADTPHPKTGTPIGDIAFFNEYGTVHIPARSFLRDWADENIPTIAKQLSGDALKSLILDSSMKESLARRGRTYRQQVIQRIKRHIPPPNAPSTIAQKDGDTPLIDTETLIDAIRYEVK